MDSRAAEYLRELDHAEVILSGSLLAPASSLFPSVRCSL